MKSKTKRCPQIWGIMDFHSERVRKMKAGSRERRLQEFLRSGSLSWVIISSSLEKGEWKWSLCIWPQNIQGKAGQEDSRRKNAEAAEKSMQEPKADVIFLFCPMSWKKCPFVLGRDENTVLMPDWLCGQNTAHPLFANDLHTFTGPGLDSTVHRGPLAAEGRVLVLGMVKGTLLAFWKNSFGKARNGICLC